MRINMTSNVSTETRDVLSATPRLVTITNFAGIAFGLAEGATLALVDVPGGSEEVREAARGYALDCTLMTVMRLALLLDDNRKVISYQSVHRCLRHPEVVTALVRRARSEAVLPASTNPRTVVDAFLRVYDRIDIGLYRRLKQFRNRGVAHLTPQCIKKRITFEELGRLVYWVASLGGCLAPLAPDVVPIREDEIAQRSKTAKEIWCAQLCGLDVSGARRD
jgi:hypothetical protein